MINRFKAPPKESVEQPPAKLLRKGMAFEADVKLGDEAHHSRPAKGQPGAPSSSHPEDSVRATLNSEKPSIEMRPPLNFSAHNKVGGAEKPLQAQDSQALSRTVADRGRKQEESRPHEGSGPKANDMFSSQREKKPSERKGAPRPDFKPRPHPHPAEEHEDRPPKPFKGSERPPRRGKGPRDSKQDGNGGWQRRGPHEEEYVAKEAPESRKRSEDSSDGGGPRVDLGNNIFRVLGRKN